MVFSPKSRQGTQTRILPRSATVILYLVELPPHFDRVSGKNNGWIKCYKVKSVIFSHFRAILAIKEPLGMQRELFSKIRECYISPRCNSMQNFRKIQWIVIENFWNAHTHGRTDEGEL